MRVIESNPVAPGRAQVGLLRLVCVFAAVTGCTNPSEEPALGADTASSIELQAPRSLNGRVVQSQASNAGYSVLFIGHAYGNFRDSQSILPARTLRENIELINQISPVFVSLLGDNVRAPEDLHISSLRSHFAEAIKAPVFVIPGEHDLFKGVDVYQAAFGAAFYRIELESELFIFLDTGDAHAAQEISALQLAFLKQALSHATDSPHIENIVVLMHKVVWVRLPRYRGLRARINNDRKGGFWPSIYPLLRDLAQSKRVFVGAGDIGHKSYSFFHDVNPSDKITYFATGLADRASDSMVRLHFPKNGSATISALSLADQPVLKAAATLDGFLEWGAGP